MIFRFGGGGYSTGAPVVFCTLDDLSETLTSLIHVTDSFSEAPRTEAQPIWDRIIAHPFFREVQAGTLPIAKFRYYVVQDYHYLEGFGRAVSVALSKAPNTETLCLLSRHSLSANLS